MDARQWLDSSIHSTARFIGDIALIECAIITLGALLRVDACVSQENDTTPPGLAPNLAVLYYASEGQLD